MQWFQSTIYPHDLLHYTRVLLTYHMTFYIIHMYYFTSHMTFYIIHVYYLHPTWPSTLYMCITYIPHDLLHYTRVLLTSHMTFYIIHMYYLHPTWPSNLYTCITYIPHDFLHYTRVLLTSLLKSYWNDKKWCTQRIKYYNVFWGSQ